MQIIDYQYIKDEKNSDRSRFPDFFGC